MNRAVPDRLRVGLSSLCLLALTAAAASAQELRTTHVVDGIYLISGAGANITVSAGSSGVMLIDAGSAQYSDQVLEAVRAISDRTIRYIINTSVLRNHVGGNAAVRAAGDTFTGGNATVVGGVDVGAAVVGHENALLRMALEEDLPTAALPTETFFVPKIDLYFNGEPVEIMHQPGAVDDANVVVHFRRSDVVSSGDVFRVDQYPYIDLDNGGSINGLLAALNNLIDIAVSDTLAEGGTLIIPGHGRICDEGDLVRYRDMVTFIRDRVQALIDRGYTLDQVIAARPSRDYDSRYGVSPDWTAEMFLEAVYRSLRAQT